MKTRREEASLLSRIVRPVTVGAGVGAAMCLLLLLLAAAVMASCQVPARVVTPISMVALSVAALAGGWSAARVSRERGLLFGAGCGLLLFFVIAVLGFTVVQEVKGSLLLLKLALAVGCGALGGVFGVNAGRR